MQFTLAPESSSVAVAAAQAVVAAAAAAVFLTLHHVRGVAKDTETFLKTRPPPV